MHLDRKIGIFGIMPNRDEIKWILILAIACALVYGNAIGGEFVYDDTRQILRNPLIQNNDKIFDALTSDVWAFKGDGTVVASNYWRPTFTAWHILNFRLFGNSVYGWHLLNILLHFGVCALIFLLLRRWQFEIKTAFAIALIFAVHPVHVESVSWISGSPDLLFTIFFLGALYFIDKYAVSDSVYDLAAALLFYAISLGAKEIGILCLPIFYLVISAKRSKTEEQRGRVLPLVSFGLVAGAYFLARLYVIGALSFPPDDPVGLSEAILSVPAMFTFYLRQIFFPWWIAANYPLAPVTSVLSTSFIVPLFVSIAALAALFISARRSHRGTIAAAIFLLPLIPAMNATAFISDQLVHDRYLYLPILGVLMIVIWQAAERIGEKKMLIVASAIALVLGLQSISYSWTWTSPLRLWTWTRKVDDSAFTAMQLGSALESTGRSKEAIDSYTHAIDKKPLARGFLGRGRALIAEKRFDEAEADLRHVLEMPDARVEAYALYQTYEALGIALSARNKIDEAANVFEEARRELPPYSAALTEKLAIVLYQKGDKDRALAELEQAREQARRELLPESKDVFLRLGMLYSERGRRDDARLALNEFLELTASFSETNSRTNRQLAAKILKSLD